VSASSQKQGIDKYKQNGSQHPISAPKKYYATNNAVETIPWPATRNTEVIPELATIQPVTLALPDAIDPAAKKAIANPTNEEAESQPVVKKVGAGKTHEVTIIIKDSVTQIDPNVTAVTKADTILFNEPNKDDAGETDPAAIEETVPLTAEEMDTVISKYAQMISVDRSEMSNFNLYLFIDEWYGTRYKWGGTDSTGIDCSAFSQKLYGKVYGVDIFRTARQQHHHAERVKYPDDAIEGDLVFFRVHSLRVSHVGVYLANGFFVHSSSSKGVVISNLNDKYWRRRFAGCGRIPKEEKSITESDYLQ